MIRRPFALIASALVVLALPAAHGGLRAGDNGPAAGGWGQVARENSLSTTAGNRQPAPRIMPAAAPAAGPAPPPLAQWRALKYGMFIHFGISTFTGRDIDPGDRPSATYAPTHLDVDQWIRVARDAGMTYAVLTAKHVPGHCLWDSKVSWHGKEFDYDVATSGDPTDVVGKFVAACNKYGLKPGLYYCLMDGRHGLGHQTWNAKQLPGPYFQLVKDQLAELLRRYGNVFYLWLDIPRVASQQQRAELYGHIKQIQPGCIVLFNHGTVRPTGPITIANFQAAWPTDVLNTERAPIRPGWFQPRQRWQGKTYQLGYEHCDTITRGSWHWLPNNPPRPAAELYQLLKQVNAAGGNLLLNVAPDRSGRIPDNYVKALAGVKKLLDRASPVRTSSAPRDKRAVDFIGRARVSRSRVSPRLGRLRL